MADASLSVIGSNGFAGSTAFINSSNYSFLVVGAPAQGMAYLYSAGRLENLLGKEVHAWSVDVEVKSGSGAGVPFVWNKLGSSSEVENSAIGNNGTYSEGSFTEGKFGGAYDNTLASTGISFGPVVGMDDAGTMETWITWDLRKLLGVPGLSFTIGGSYSSGQNLSDKDIGNVFGVQSAFSGRGTVNLQQMYLQQQFLDGALTIALGRLAPGNTFATLPVLNNYINGGMNNVPGSHGNNDPTFTTSPPGVEWGAQVIYDVTPSLQIATGIFNTNPYAAAGSDNGLNFAFQQGNSGVLIIGQVSHL